MCGHKILQSLNEDGIQICTPYQCYILPLESESESEIFYLTIIHVQFIMKVIHLLNTEVNDDFVKACQRLLSQEPPSSLQVNKVHSIFIITWLTLIGKKNIRI